MSARVKTNYPGVYYRKTKRIGGKGSERVYYIRFKKDGKVIEEKAGRQFVDDMTPARAASFRADRIEGKQKSRSDSRIEKQKREAERKLEEKRVKEEKANLLTIDQIWQKYKSTRKIKGIIFDESRYNNHLKERFGAKHPEEITPLDYEQLKTNLTETGLSATSVRHCMELLRRLINFAAKMNLCEPSKFKVELPKLNNQKTEDLTLEQLKRLLIAIEEAEDQAAASMMKLALFTGMRKGEILRLQWNDIDFSRGFVILRNPKGGLNETIPLSHGALEIIEKQPRTSNYVFPGRSGGMRVDIRKQVNKIKREAGLPEDFRPMHGLRHTFASVLASSGQVDMYTLQKLLTHKSPQMTQRYAHLRDDTLRRGAELAANLLNGNQTLSPTNG